jgi:Leucine-rich repeat (LRR) protein
MKNIIIFTVVVLLSVSNISAQDRNFCNADMEAILKQKFGLTGTQTLTPDMTDTVTSLNLAGYGITDIRDIVYFPSLQELDLSFNGLKDIAPLLELSNLRYLNIQDNFLETIDLLALSESFQMTVVLSGNYIRDFYAITHSPQCLFSIIGMNLQNPFPFQVRQLYTDFDLNDMQGLLTCDYWDLHSRDTSQVKHANRQYPVTPDSVYQVKINAANSLVSLIVDEQTADSTYFIPPTTVEVEATANAIVFVPVFPDEEYAVLSVEAFHSEAECSNDSVFVKFTGDSRQDTLKVGCGIPVPNGVDRLKGYTYYFTTDKSTSIEEIDASKIQIYPNPTQDNLTISGLSGNEDIILTDISGRTLYRGKSDGATEMQIPVSDLAKGTYLLRISSKAIIKTFKVMKE